MPSMQSQVYDAALRTAFNGLATTLLMLEPVHSQDGPEFHCFKAEIGNGERLFLKAARAPSAVSTLTVMGSAEATDWPSRNVVLDCELWNGRLLAALGARCLSNSPVASLPELKTWIEALCREAVLAGDRAFTFGPAPAAVGAPGAGDAAVPVMTGLTTRSLRALVDDGKGATLPTPVLRQVLALVEAAENLGLHRGPDGDTHISFHPPEAGYTSKIWEIKDRAYVDRDQTLPVIDAFAAALDPFRSPEPDGD